MSETVVLDREKAVQNLAELNQMLEEELKEFVKLFPPKPGHTYVMSQDGPVEIPILIRPRQKGRR